MAEHGSDSDGSCALLGQVLSGDWGSACSLNGSSLHPEIPLNMIPRSTCFILSRLTAMVRMVGGREFGEIGSSLDVCIPEKKMKEL